MLATLERAGFRDARWTPYTFGIAGLYTARKAIEDTQNSPRWPGCAIGV